MRVIQSIAEFFGYQVDEASICDEAIESAAESLAVQRLALYVGVSYVANAISKCEWKVYDHGKPVEDELYWALNFAPNPNECGSTFANHIVESIFYDGHALVVQPNSRKPDFFVAQNFTRDGRPKLGDRFTGISIESNGTQEQVRDMRCSDVWYFRLDNKDVAALFRGFYNDMGQLLSAASSGFRQSCGQKWTLSYTSAPSGQRSDEAKAQAELNDRMKAFMRNPSIVMPLYRGQEIAPMKPSGGASSTDFISLRKDAFETAALAFHIPQSMLYGNMTNVDEVLRQFVTFSVDPLARMISDEITRKTFGFDLWKSGCRVSLDTSKVSHLDMFDVADKVDKLISSGVYSIDEVRKELKADELNTEFSKAHWITKNFTEINEALQMQLDI